MTNRKKVSLYKETTVLVPIVGGTITIYDTSHTRGGLSVALGGLFVAMGGLSVAAPIVQCLYNDQMCVLESHVIP